MLYWIQPAKLPRKAENGMVVKWPPGPWDQEHDAYSWVDRLSGYLCIVNRSPVAGSFCGYVVVPSGHPCYGMVDVDYKKVSAHGGINFSHEFEHLLAAQKLPLPATWGTTEGWVFGFDTAHAGDYCPAIQALLTALGHKPFIFKDSLFGEDVYREWPYMKAEVDALAEQLFLALPELPPPTFLELPYGH